MEGSLLLGDMCQGIPFKPVSFDGCISIPAVQQLCNANKKSKPSTYTIFSSLSSFFWAFNLSAKGADLKSRPSSSNSLVIVLHV
jgi:18S rRNA (guanine1575-N7)-methyltransferase